MGDLERVVDLLTQIRDLLSDTDEPTPPTDLTRMQVHGD